jgi:hypothetical protein
MAMVAVTVMSLFGCTKAPKENEVHVVKDSTEKKDISKIDKALNAEGSSPFFSLEGLNIKENRNQIPLTLSKDKEYVYYMKPTVVKPKDDGYKVIKGETNIKVDIIKVHMVTADTKSIVNNVPFVSSIKWNKEGNMVAFLGGNTLTVYNDNDNKLIQSFQGDGDGITSFGWSPEGKKIYTEGQNLINTGIYYTDSKKYVHSYETKESLFYKGVLDSQYLFGTERIGDGSYNTAIADKEGKVASRVESSGRYRDSYKTSFLQIGKDNFGLEYHSDINESNNIKVLSKEYISDAKFIYNGDLVYITPNDNPEENNFYLHIANSKGDEVKKLQVSGSTIMILPDGKLGYIGGTHIERVNLINYSIEGPSMERPSEESESILRTLRGAMDVIYKFEIAQKKDVERANKYFIDSNSPGQWALTDVMNIFNEKVKLTPEASDYNLMLRLKGLSINKYQATANISVEARNSIGSGVGMSNTVELIKRDNKWYVTGLSTFPNSKQYKEVKSKVEDLVKQAQQGNLFNGELKDKEVQIGQIQFWQLSDPHLADNIDNANYCKVYLKVKENGTEVLYKLILDKKNQNYWKEGGVSKERLSLLF